MSYIKLNIIIITAFFYCLSAHAVPTHNTVPGGVAVIDLPFSSHDIKTILYGEKRINYSPHADNPTRTTAVVGIPLDAKLGSNTLNLSMQDGSQKVISFVVKDKQYKEQHIKLASNDKVTPNTKALERIKHETALFTKAYNSWHNEPLPNYNFIQPVSGPLTSPFGLKRFFNNKPRNPHSGIDIAAVTGTPVLAAGNGEVILAGNFFFNGNTILIAHGQSLVTMYCHLDSIKVIEGSTVQQGDIIGMVGETGRVTGAHLHWSVSLNGYRVDPMLFIQ